jgi:hypothetical protein
MARPVRIVAQWNVWGRSAYDGAQDPMAATKVRSEFEWEVYL